MGLTLLRKVRKRMRRLMSGIGLGKKDDVPLSVSTRYSEIGEPGPIIRDIYGPLSDVPGWFNVDDCGHFSLILSYQKFTGIRGDILEIGSYHGRSSAMLASCLAEDEKIVICDAFEADTEDPYSNRPTPDKLIRNILRVNKNLREDRIVIHKCLSNDLRLSNDEKFRFIHIDGGHAAEQVFSDLALCAPHLVPGGVIAVDDYGHPKWPGVKDGTDEFLASRDGLYIFADLNRHGALGRKVYLAFPRILESLK